MAPELFDNSIFHLLGDERIIKARVCQTFCFEPNGCSCRWISGRPSPLGCRAGLSPQVLPSLAIGWPTGPVGWCVSLSSVPEALPGVSSPWPMDFLKADILTQSSLPRVSLRSSAPRSGQAHPVKGSSLFLQGLGTSAAPAPSCPVLGTTPLAPALALASAVPLNPSLPSCTWRELPEAPAWHNLPPVCRKEVSHWLPGLGFPTWGVFTSSQQPRPP